LPQRTEFTTISGGGSPESTTLSAGGSPEFTTLSADGSSDFTTLSADGSPEFTTLSGSGSLEKHPPVATTKHSQSTSQTVSSTVPEDRMMPPPKVKPIRVYGRNRSNRAPDPEPAPEPPSKSAAKPPSKPPPKPQSEPATHPAEPTQSTPSAEPQFRSRMRPRDQVRRNDTENETDRTEKPREFSSEFLTQESRNDRQSLKSRSVLRFGPQYVKVLTHAQNIINSYTLMKDPFPDPTETNAMIETAWVSAAEKDNLRASVQRKPSLNIASQPASYRFSAAQIPRLIYQQFVSRPGALSLLDVSFLSSMNRNLICLVSTAICWALPAHSTGHFVKPSNFNWENYLSIYKSQLNTWIPNFPDDELEELMVEEIVRQTLGWAKKSGLSVPESETTEAHLD
ncbi:hypothetical protein Q9L58_010615, partial [Maublancomyces gigas]